MMNSTAMAKALRALPHIRGDQPGHVYMDALRRVTVYVGRGTLLDPSTLDVLSGHVYVRLRPAYGVLPLDSVHIMTNGVVRLTGLQHALDYSMPRVVDGALTFSQPSSRWRPSRFYVDVVSRVRSFAAEVMTLPAPTAVTGAQLLHVHGGRHYEYVAVQDNNNGLLPFYPRG